MRVRSKMTDAQMNWCKDMRMRNLRMWRQGNVTPQFPGLSQPNIGPLSLGAMSVVQDMTYEQWKDSHPNTKRP
jgi:hypothetical protein